MNGMIEADERVIGHQQQRLGLCLGDQQTVERIAMMRRQMADGSSMNGGHRQLAKAGFHGGAMDRVRLDVEIQPVEGALDRDLPSLVYVRQGRRENCAFAYDEAWLANLLPATPE